MTTENELKESSDVFTCQTELHVETTVNHQCLYKSLFKNLEKCKYSGPIKGINVSGLPDFHLIR